MVTLVSDILKKYAAGKKAAVAVSGGCDSMCLLDIVLSCDFINKQDILVITVDHGIREEGAADARFVQGYCESRGVKVRVFHEDIPKKARLSGNSEESEARLLRQEIFAQTVLSGDADIVLTAHHAQDNAESVLMHILRGSGLKGASGMSVYDEKRCLLRPLLYADKTAIDKYVSEKNIPFVTDATNADSKYARNFLRNEVFPLLNTRWDAVKSLNSFAAIAANDDEYIRSNMDGTLIGGDSEMSYILNTAFSSPEPLIYRYLTAALSVIGVNSDVTAAHYRAVAGLSGKENGKKIELAGAVIAAKEYDRIVFYKKSEKQKAAAQPFSSGIFEFPNSVIEVNEVPCDLVKDTLSKNGNTLFADAAAFPEDCVIRTREDGDVFTPFGGGKKKLKEYFIDKKIPARLRGGIPLVCKGSEVLVIAGVEISDKVRLTEKTTKAYEIILQKMREVNK